MDPQDSSKATNWTGGQFSALRVLLGLWFFFGHAYQLFEPGRAVLSPYSPQVRVVLSVVGCLLSLAFLVGKGDRWAALGLLGMQFSFPITHFYGVGVPSLLLLFHAMAPMQPYGSWEARGRVDPAGDWKISEAWHSTVLRALAAVCFFGGLAAASHSYWDAETQFGDYRESLFAGGWLDRYLPSLLSLATLLDILSHLALLPILLFQPKRTKFAWAFALATTVLVPLPHVSIPHLIFFLLAFDPAWVAPARQRGGEGPETIFYDGECGLCHRAVRFVLSEDLTGRFHFAPLQGEAFKPFEAEAKKHGDTMFLARPDGSLLARSDAWVEILRGVGGGWRVLGQALGLLPSSLRDLVYDGIARIRKSIFAAPKSACPMLPPHLIERFTM